MVDKAFLRDDMYSPLLATLDVLSYLWRACISFSSAWLSSTCYSLHSKCTTDMLFKSDVVFKVLLIMFENFLK